MGDFLDDVQPGEVVVIDNGGRTDCTVWGGIMSLAAPLRGVEGTVIDGVCRDVSEIKKNHYKMFSKGYYMATGKDRVEVDYVNQPVNISGVQVRPGDLILGDETGVLVIPIERAQAVYEIAKDIMQKEAQIQEALHAGTTLRSAREKMKYHELQTRQESVLPG